MDMVEEIVEDDVPLTNDGCPFCTIYDLKGVCNYKYNGWHMHMRLSSRDHSPVLWQLSAFSNECICWIYRGIKTKHKKK